MTNEAAKTLDAMERAYEALERRHSDVCARYEAEVRRLRDRNTLAATALGWALLYAPTDEQSAATRAKAEAIFEMLTDGAVR